MLQPNTWDAIACHSGDVGFETMFLPTFAETLTHVRRFGGVADYVQHIRDAVSLSGPDFHSLMICAMAASYDPQPPTEDNPLGIVLPLDEETAIVEQEAWSRWMNFDPLVMIESKHDSLAQLKCLFIDCGNRDQYHIQYGSRRFVERLTAFNVPHMWEEFDGTHSGIDFRLDSSFSQLSNVLS